MATKPDEDARRHKSELKTQHEQEEQQADAERAAPVPPGTGRPAADHVSSERSGGRSTAGGGIYVAMVIPGDTGMAAATGTVQCPRRFEGHPFMRSESRATSERRSCSIQFSLYFLWKDAQKCSVIDGSNLWKQPRLRRAVNRLGYNRPVSMKQRNRKTE